MSLFNKKKKETEQPKLTPAEEVEALRKQVAEKKQSISDIHEATKLRQELKELDKELELENESPMVKEIRNIFKSIRSLKKEDIV